MRAMTNGLISEALQRGTALALAIEAGCDDDELRVRCMRFTRAALAVDRSVFGLHTLGLHDAEMN